MMLYKLKLAVCFAIPEGFGTCIISLVDESEKELCLLRLLNM